MFNALFYLWWNSLKNRTTMRFKRLNQPKYLIGFIVGAVAGGMLELSSMLFGLRALFLFAALLYGLALWVGIRRPAGLPAA